MVAKNISPNGIINLNIMVSIATIIPYNIWPNFVTGVVVISEQIYIDENIIYPVNKLNITKYISKLFINAVKLSPKNRVINIVTGIIFFIDFFIIKYKKPIIVNSILTSPIPPGTLPTKNCFNEPYCLMFCSYEKSVIVVFSIGALLYLVASYEFK